MEFSIYGLFCLCHPGDGIRYVGQTTRTVEERFREHLSLSPLMALSNWIRKHGPDNIGYTVLEICSSRDDCDDREIAWIEFLDTFNNGMNFTTGGGGVRNGRPSAETREKISKSLKGRKHTPEQNQKQSERQRGKKLSPNAYAAIPSGPDHHQYGKRGELSQNYGLVRSDETREKLRQANLGKKVSDEVKAKLSEALSGEKNPGSKLTLDQVQEIRKRLESPYRGIVQDLAAEYGVHRVTIRRLSDGTNWQV